tara:strand:- start:144 stop:410 length:267 start_codon:yes stop_codon:yes gene_type:complete
MIKKQPLSEIITMLEFTNKRASNVLIKAFKSAIANTKNNHSTSNKNLKLKMLEINEGAVLKRWRPVSRGSAHPYKKRMSHIKIILTDK